MGMFFDDFFFRLICLIFMGLTAFKKDLKKLQANYFQKKF